MKKYLFILCPLLLLTSCMSDEEKLIQAFEEHILDSQIDLSFKPIETKKLSDALAGDSLTYYENLLIEEGKNVMAKCKYDILTLDYKISTDKIEYKYETYKPLCNRKITMYNFR